GHARIHTWVENVRSHGTPEFFQGPTGCSRRSKNGRGFFRRKFLFIRERMSLAACADLNWTA
ncbi:MAG: hypothetical protein KIY11_08150, partial [Thermoplasmata archaeon]|nr:hypothetical protein [Candidatus Sysuiplasma acidicola]